MLLAGGAISGLTLLAVALLPFYYLAVGLMVFLGIGDAGRRALNQALVMEVADDAYRGRVWSVFMMNFGLVPLGVLPCWPHLGMAGWPDGHRHSRRAVAVHCRGAAHQPEKAEGPELSQVALHLPGLR